MTVKTAIKILSKIDQPDKVQLCVQADGHKSIKNIVLEEDYVYNTSFRHLVINID